MYKQSRSFYFFFMWLASSSVTGMFFHTADAFLLAGNGVELTWIKIAVYLMGLPGIFIFAGTKLNAFLKTLFGIVSALAVVIAGKYFMQYVMRIPAGDLLPLSSLAVVGGLIAFSINFFYLLFFSRYRSFFRYLENEPNFESLDAYGSWLNEEGVEKIAKLLKKSTAVLSNIAILLLLLSFFSIVRNPSAKLFHSVYFVVYCISALGMYFILKQFDSLLNWKIQKLEVPASVVSQWNKLLKIFLIPLILIPLAVPWYFRVFDVSKFTEYLNNRLSGVTLDIGTDNTEARANFETGTTVPGQQNTQTTVTGEDHTPVRNVVGTTRRGWKDYIKYVLWGLAGLFGLYFVLGIVGAIFFRKLRYNKKSGFIRFFIRIYESLRGLIDGLGIFFTAIGGFFAALFGLHKFRGKVNDKDLAHPVAAQLFALFGENNELSDEKKDEIRTIVRDFVKMIEVTGRFVTPYRFYYGPMEYIDLVIERMPELKETLLLTVKIFNESRYSLHILSDVKIGNFQGAVKYVIDKVSEYSEQSPEGAR